MRIEVVNYIYKRGGSDEEKVLRFFLPFLGKNFKWVVNLYIRT